MQGLSQSYGSHQRHPPGSSASERHTVRKMNSQLHQTEYGTRVHVITPELFEGTHHPHITPILWSVLFDTTHLTCLWYGESWWRDQNHYQRAHWIEPATFRFAAQHLNHCANRRSIQTKIIVQYLKHKLIPRNPQNSNSIFFFFLQNNFWSLTPNLREGSQGETCSRWARSVRVQEMSR